MPSQSILFTALRKIPMALGCVMIFSSLCVSASANGGAHGVVDTGQTHCYDTTKAINCPTGRFSGQDAQYLGPAPAYQDHGDGTVTDLNTDLMWQQDPGGKKTYDAAVAGAASFRLAGYDDWRLPSIKELYSLIDFEGVDPDLRGDGSRARPFIDTHVFEFAYGDPSVGDRIIDSQWATSTIYKSTVMNHQQCFFGVNFADGRIKCYPTNPRKLYYVLYVRGPRYGVNDFSDNRDGTITDRATGLVWQRADNAAGINWPEALAYCENLFLGGKDDWRLPNVKELQSIVDYSRSPDSTGSAAIDPLFSSSRITNEAGQADYPFYWSSTTHVGERGATNAAYVAFGRALGYMRGRWMDVHGAGAQRSDPKTGSPEDFPQGRGPQGDARRATNYVRCVRAGVTPSAGEPASTAPKTVSTADRPGPGRGGPPPGGNSGPGRGGPPGGNSGPGRGGPQGGNPGFGQGGPSGGNTRRSPPQPAINACRNLQDGASCSFSSPRGTVRGTCRTLGREQACVPLR